MKKYLFIFLTTTILLLLSAPCISRDSSHHKTKKLQTNAIVTLNQKIKPMSSFVNILNETINEIHSNPKFDNLILFVHGRGKHPQKAFEKSLLSDLESNYSAKVIMFHWPSWEGPLAFPVKKARSAAADFSFALKKIDEYRLKNSPKISGINVTLFTNSMGSFVLEESVLTIKKHSLNKIFDTIVINAPASAANNHSKWVDKIDFSDDIYITINADDKLLGKIGTRLIGKRLGKGLTSMFGRKFNLASNVKYIDLTESQLKHRYYLHRDLNDRPVAKEFYNQVLNGKPALLDSKHGLSQIKRKQVYILEKEL